jgi:hypothetical protein
MVLLAKRAGQRVAYSQATGAYPSVMLSLPHNDLFGGGRSYKDGNFLFNRFRLSSAPWLVEHGLGLLLSASVYDRLPQSKASRHWIGHGHRLTRALRYALVIPILLVHGVTALSSAPTSSHSGSSSKNSPEAT